MAKKVKTHPFYCYKRNCRKSAWKTPEYMEESDWLFLRKIVATLEQDDPKEFADLLDDNCFSHTNADYENFFNRAVGWPEGARYCTDREYVVKTAFRGIKRNHPELKKAVEDHFNA